MVNRTPEERVKRLAYQRAYRLTNRERLLAQDRARYAANLDKFRAKRRRFHLAHQEEERRRSREYRAANRAALNAKERARWRDTRYVERLQARYGLDEATYRQMVAVQGGACAVCGQPATQVDHDHKTNRVRALLCVWCNRALGMAQDDPVRLRRLADYLDQWNLGGSIDG